VIAESMLWGHINGPILRTMEHQFGRHQNVTGDNEEYATKLWPSFPPMQYEKQGHDVKVTRPGAGAKRARKQGGKHAARHSF